MFFRSVFFCLFLQTGAVPTIIYFSGCAPPPADGDITVKRLPENGSPIQPGHVITFTCDGSGKYLNGSAVLTCGEDGQWDNPFPSCGDPVGCGKPPPLADGDTREALLFQYRHGQKVTYICQNYYTMEGEPYKTCVNGEWIGQIRCLKPCTVDKEIMSTHKIIFRYSRDDKLYSTHNDQVYFMCTRGTRQVGTLNMRQTCIDGVMQLPTCQ